VKISDNDKADKTTLWTRKDVHTREIAEWSKKQNTLKKKEKKEKLKIPR